MINSVFWADLDIGNLIGDYLVDSRAFWSPVSLNRMMVQNTRLDYFRFELFVELMTS